MFLLRNGVCWHLKRKRVILRVSDTDAALNKTARFISVLVLRELSGLVDAFSCLSLMLQQSRTEQGASSMGGGIGEMLEQWFSTGGSRPPGGFAHRICCLPDICITIHNHSKSIVMVK